MKLWLLQISTQYHGNIPLERKHHLVVEAVDETSARELAEKETGNLGIWLSPVRSSCKELVIKGEIREAASGQTGQGGTPRFSFVEMTGPFLFVEMKGPAVAGL
jgi:hypothetical protein